MQTIVNSSTALRRVMLRSSKEGYVVTPDAVFKLVHTEADAHSTLLTYEHINPTDSNDTYIAYWGISSGEWSSSLKAEEVLSELETAEKVLRELKTQMKALEAAKETKLLLVERIFGSLESPVGPGLPWDNPNFSGKSCTQEVKRGSHSGEICGIPLIVGEEYCYLCQKEVKKPKVDT